MDTINSGGPAFPAGLASGHIEPLHHGMTLRDYFAAKAMAAAISSHNCPEEFDGAHVAAAAYEMAGAMLRAREAA